MQDLKNLNDIALKIHRSLVTDEPYLLSNAINEYQLTTKELQRVVILIALLSRRNN